MSEAAARFDGNIPENYDRFLGPVIFEPYAKDLARRLESHRGDHVLEIACGTGIATKLLRRSLPLTCDLTATDLNPAMLEIAKKQLGELPRLRWQQADAIALPFPDSVFSAVACQFGFMFVPDKPAAYREARRVLSKGGNLVFNVWDSMNANPFARIAHDTIGSLFPSDPPAFFKVPFGFFDPEAIQNLLASNGFDQIKLEFIPLEARSESAESFAIGCVNGTPISIDIQERGLSRDSIIKAVAKGLGEIGGDRPFRSSMQAIVVTARAA